MQKIKNRYTDKSRLDEVLFELTGSGEREFFSLMRQEYDPWSAIDEVIEAVRGTTEEAEDFIQKCEDFKATFDQSLVEQRLQRENEEHQEDKYDTRYSARQFRRDVWNIDDKVKFITDGPIKHSREQWERTIGKDDELWFLLEWGNFSMDITKKMHESMLKVQTHIRKGIPYLGVGAVQINMQDGHAKCWTSGCKWEEQLINDVDRECMEYQVLLILEHLGSHTLKNSRNYWTPIKSVKRFRDDPNGRMRIYKRGAGLAAPGGPGVAQR